MSGAMGNVQLVHVDVSRPEGEYDDRPLDWFVGRAVKMTFAAAGGTAEHMWVEVTGIDGDRLVGELASEPVVARHLKCGDRVELGRVQVEAVYLSPDEWVAEADRLWARAEFADRRRVFPKPPAVLVALHAAGFTPLQALRRWAACRPAGAAPATGTGRCGDRPASDRGPKLARE